MKYSQEQISNIKNYYKDLRLELKLEKIRNEGKKSIFIDKQLPENLLDKRTAYDIENDKFARNALLIDYTNDLVKNGSPHELQQKLEQEGYDEFFINNYPKIKSDARMFRQQNPSTMFDLVKRLYNKSQQELLFLSNNSANNTNTIVVIQSLKDINDKLLAFNATLLNPQQQQQNMDYINKLQALIVSMKFVGNKIQFLEDVFGEAYPAIKNAISTINMSMSQTNDPNNPQTISDLNQLLSAIDPQTIQQAVNSQSSQKPSSQTQSQTQTKKTQQYDINNVNTDIMTFTDADLENLKYFINDAYTTNNEYAEKLSQILQIKNKRIFTNKPTKEIMFEEFQRKLIPIREEMIINQTNNTEREKRRQEEEYKLIKQYQEEEKTLMKSREEQAKAQEIKKKAKYNEIEKLMDLINFFLNLVYEIELNYLANDDASKNKLINILKYVKQTPYYDKFDTVISGIKSTYEAKEIRKYLLSNIKIIIQREALTLNSKINYYKKLFSAMPNYVNVETIKAVEEFDNAINKAIIDKQQNPQGQNLYDLYIGRLVKLEELYNQQNNDESMKKNAIMQEVYNDIRQTLPAVYETKFLNDVDVSNSDNLYLSLKTFLVGVLIPIGENLGKSKRTIKKEIKDIINP
jgi:hypothetical protein